MSDVSIRDLSGMDEFRAAEQVQREVWGDDDTPDPADLMMVIQAEGGLCAGAFRDGRMLGYVFAFPTREPHVQHSHRLAVVSEARGLQLGTRLKWFQRDWCLARGITLSRWTFDPLRRVNAGLNIAVLGAVARVYYPDYYGAMLGINAGLPSDRLLAEWRLGSAEVAARAEGRGDADKAEVIARVAIPPDYEALLAQDPDAAVGERLRLRTALTGAFAQGQMVVGFDRGENAYLIGAGA